MFAVGTASAPQFEQNIWELKELDAAMLDLSPTAFACTIRAQDPFLWFWFWMRFEPIRSQLIRLGQMRQFRELSLRYNGPNETFVLFEVVIPKETFV